MEFTQFTKSECPICAYEDITITCPFCHEKACKKCIMKYNYVNDTKKCLCPSCKIKFNKLISYMIFGGESKYFLQSQMKKYRDFITINSICVDFYKAFSKINKSQLDKLMNIPNYQLLLNYYIGILKNKKYISVEHLINSYYFKLFDQHSDDNYNAFNIIMNSNKKSKKIMNDILSTANEIILNKHYSKKWILENERNAHGPECYYIKRKPMIFEKVISENKKQQIVEIIQDLCISRKRYLYERLKLGFNILFDNSKYRCIHCKTFTLDDDITNSKNAEFNKKYILMGDDISTFECIGDADVSYQNMEKNSFDNGYIVKRIVKTFKFKSDEKMRIFRPYEFNSNELKYKYYVYICERISSLYKPKSKAKKMKFLNDLEIFKNICNICLIGQTPEQHDLCDLMFLNIQKLIHTQNFDEKLIDTLKEKILINSGDDENITRIHNFIKDQVYGPELSSEEIRKLDDILISTSKHDEEYNVEVLNNKKDIVYDDIFKEINKKYLLYEYVDKLSFQKCNKCNGYIIMNDKNERRCIKCNTRYCTKCSEIFENENHICDPDILESMKLITKECHKCPCCGVPIFKISECNHMLCTNCHNGFDWKTGNILDESEQTNPSYFEWIELQKNSDKIQDNITDEEPYEIPFDVNPYKWTKYQFEKLSRYYTEKIKSHQNIFAQNLICVMENDDKAINILHNINKNKCLLGFTKYSFDGFNLLINNLFNEYRNVNNQLLLSTIKNYFDTFQQQCAYFNALFILSITGEKRIQKSLDNFVSNYRRIYDKIINIMEGEGIIKLIIHTNGDSNGSDGDNVGSYDNGSNDGDDDNNDEMIYSPDLIYNKLFNNHIFVKYDYNFEKVKEFILRTRLKRNNYKYFDKCFDIITSFYPYVPKFDTIMKRL